jgi:hypothetical protein
MVLPSLALSPWQRASFQLPRRTCMRFKTVALATSLAAFAATLSGAHAQDAIGVASCDGFLKAYQSCIIDKATGDAKTKAVGDFDKLKANFKDVAASAEGKAKLDQTCKDTTAQMKTVAPTCAW